MTTDALIGSAEAAIRLGKSTRYVHRLVSAGKLRPVVTAPGGQVGTFLFDVTDIDALSDDEDAA